MSPRARILFLSLSSLFFLFASAHPGSHHHHHHQHDPHHLDSMLPLSPSSSPHLDPSASALNFTPVFTPHEGGYPCIRIPSILLVGTDLLAFAECRNFTGDGCLPAAFDGVDGDAPVQRNMNRDICMKRSEDKGRTWGPLQVIARNACQGTPVFISQTRTLLLSFNRVTNTDNFQMYSTDLGHTWSEPENITQSLGPRAPYYVGPGVGIELQNSKHAGRLLFIGHHGPYEYDGVWYSDDGGVTYALSNTSFNYMDEAQLAELPDGRILATLRNDHRNTTCPCQAMAVSEDGGASFGPVYYDPTLITPVCMASILTYKDKVYFSNPASPSDRVNGTLRSSSNGGQTWSGTLGVTQGAFGYSCLSLTPDEGVLGLLWETSMNARVCAGESCQTVYSTFPADF